MKIIVDESVSFRGYLLRAAERILLLFTVSFSNNQDVDADALRRG